MSSDIIHDLGHLITLVREDPVTAAGVLARVRDELGEINDGLDGINDVEAGYALRCGLASMPIV